MKLGLVILIGVIIGYIAFLFAMYSGYSAGVSQFVGAIVSVGVGFSMSSLSRKFGWVK
ncbi:hypothetical protein QTV43_000519 [Vibrio vulnificus]|nr:hypothetical protein [Vibrio vulnificus]